MTRCPQRFSDGDWDIAPAAWAKRSDDARWHVVVQVAGGSVVTRCNGRWHADESFEKSSNPIAAERCAACVRGGA